MQPEEPRWSLIPQFSIRWLLGVTAGAAVLFSIVALGTRGHAWAAAVSIAVVSLVVLIAVYALVFALVWLASLVLSRFDKTSSGPAESPLGQSPFGQAMPEPDAPASDKDVPAVPVVLD